ncbi:MAG: hypothetical protein IJU28_06215 [Clostridia bacterium]|nr:hypothetical protein [Clostridia bacterium]
MKLKRLLALVLMLLLAAGDVVLADDWYAKTKDKVTLYKSASSSSSTVATIESGQWLFVSGIKDGWAKVSYNGKTGFVSSSKVKKTAKAVYVKADSAGIYKSASTSSTKLSTAPYGAKLDAYYKTGDYTHVVYGKYEGFIKTSSIQLTKPEAKASVSSASASSAKSSSSTSTNSSSSKSSSSWGTAVNKTLYVKTGYANLYQSPSTSAGKNGFAPYGCKVTVTAVNGDWCKCTYGSISGYCKKTALTSDNPNNLNNTVYVKSKSVRIYKIPSTSGQYTTISTSTALKQTAKYDSTWSRVTYNSNVGFVKTSELTASKSSSSSSASSSSTSSPSSGKSVAADWFKSNIQSEFYKGRVATVTDVNSRISWKVKRKGGSNHADVEPLTAADTAAMKKACGSDFMTWHRRAIWVSLDGKKYAASMNCMAHGLCNITNNNFDGHFCIHFTNSRTHGTDKVDADHQNAIKRARSAG